METPQSLDSGESEVARCRFADWAIRSGTLDPLKITSELGIHPSRAWAKGERYLSKALDVEAHRIVHTWYTRPWGIWAIQTKGLLTAEDVEPHVLFLLDMLEPRKGVIKRYLERVGEYTIRCAIMWESNVEHGGFDISSDTMARMTALCHYLQFTYVPLLGSREDEE